jgi:hypothetical protein
VEAKPRARAGSIALELANGVEDGDHLAAVFARSLDFRRTVVSGRQ